MTFLIICAYVVFFCCIRLIFAKIDDRSETIENLLVDTRKRIIELENKK